MTRTRTLPRLTLAGSAALVLVGAASGAASAAEPVDTIRICHATTSNAHPYVANSPSTSGDLAGHAGHTGPVWGPDLKATHTAWGDVIPPFTRVVDGLEVPFAGLNWDAAGQAIWENGCALPPSGTTEPTPDDTDGPGESDSASSVGEPGIPPQDGEVDAPEGETPGDTPDVDEPAEEATAEESGPDTFTGGSGTITFSRPTAVTVGGGQLPRTGVPVDTWSVAGAWLLAAGLLLLLAGRPRTARR